MAKERSAFAVGAAASGAYLGSGARVRRGKKAGFPGGVTFEYNFRSPKKAAAIGVGAGGSYKAYKVVKKRRAKKSSTKKRRH